MTNHFQNYFRDKPVWVAFLAYFIFGSVIYPPVEALWNYLFHNVSVATTNEAYYLFVMVMLDTWLIWSGIIFESFDRIVNWQAKANHE